MSQSLRNQYFGMAEPTCALELPINRQAPLLNCFISLLKHIYSSKSTHTYNILMYIWFKNVADFICVLLIIISCALPCIYICTFFEVVGLSLARVVLAM